MKQKIILPIFFMLILLGNASANWTITEILYDPDGTDSDREWIELFGNPFSDNVKFFEDGGIHSLTFIQGNCMNNCVIIIADDYINFLTENSIPDEVLVYDSSWASLKNTGEEIGIIEENKTVEIVNYAPTANSGESLQLFNNQWISDTPNPGEWNNVAEIPEFSSFAVFFIVLAVIGTFIARRLK